MKVDAKTLTVIQDSIHHTMSIIRTLACENYPYTEFDDSDIGRMYYEMNTMCLCISNKINGLEATACLTTDITPASSSASGPVS